MGVFEFLKPKKEQIESIDEMIDKAGKILWLKRLFPFLCNLNR